MFLTLDIASMQNDLLGNGMDPRWVQSLADVFGNCGADGVHRGQIVIDINSDDALIGAEPAYIGAAAYQKIAPLAVLNAIAFIDGGFKMINGCGFNCEGPAMFGPPVPPPGGPIGGAGGNQGGDGDQGGHAPGGTMRAFSDSYMPGGVFIHGGAPLYIFDSSNNPMVAVKPWTPELALCGIDFSVKTAADTEVFRVDQDSATPTVTTTGGADLVIKDDTGSKDFLKVDASGNTLRVGSTSEGVTFYVSDGVSYDMFEVNPSTGDVTVRDKLGTAWFVLDPDNNKTMTIDGTYDLVYDSDTGDLTLGTYKVIDENDRWSYGKYASSQLTLSTSEQNIPLNTNISNRTLNSWTATTDGVNLPETGVYQFDGQAQIYWYSSGSGRLRISLRVYVFGTLELEATDVLDEWSSAYLTLRCSGLIYGASSTEVLMKIIVNTEETTSDAGNARTVAGEQYTYMTLDRLDE